MKVQTFDWVKDNDEVVGFGCMITQRGNKPKTLMNGDVPYFPTEKEAKAAGNRFINSETLKQETNSASRG